MTAHAFAGWPTKPAISAAVLGVSTLGSRDFISTGHVETTRESIFRVASLTKAFTSAALVLEMRDQSVSLSTPAIEFFPDLVADWRADPAVTVADLLAQVAGLRETVDASVAAAAGEEEDALTRVVRSVVGAGTERHAGARWSYYNGNYFLAGAILARLRHTTFETALRERLLRPWGLMSSGFDDPDDAIPGWRGDLELPAQRYPRARRPSGGLWSTATDLLAFGEHILADQNLLELTSQRRTRLDDPMSYGLGWALGPSRQMYLNGRLPGYRAALLLVPSHALVCTNLSAQEEALPLIADTVNRQQLPLTGDDLSAAINDFAA